jgi:hypothetical protein
MTQRGGTRMKRLVWLCVTAMLMAACALAPGGGSSTGGNSSAGGGKASIDLTVSGAVQGTSTQLAKYDCSGGEFGSFAASFDPVMNGKQYNIAILITSYKGAPVTIDLPAPNNNVLVQFGNDQSGIYHNDSHTTGSVTINAGGDSGAVDASFEPPAVFGFAPLQMKFTFTCPVNK